MDRKKSEPLSELTLVVSILQYESYCRKKGIPLPRRRKITASHMKETMEDVFGETTTYQYQSRRLPKSIEKFGLKHETEKHRKRTEYFLWIEEESIKRMCKKITPEYQELLSSYDGVGTSILAMVDKFN